MGEKLPLRKVIRDLSLPAVLAFGNPLLDYIVTLNDNDILEKYGLKADGAVEFPEYKIQDILAEISPEATKRIGPGGCAQNTARIMQWLFGGAHTPSVCIFCGGLGKDIRGARLQNMVTAEKVQTRYAVHSNLATGVCISLISGSSRSLVANLGAASFYTLNDLKESHLPLDRIKIIYIEGFFIVHSFDVAREIVKMTQDKNVIIAFNLSGEYIFEEYHAEICEMVGLSKIVFGNAREMTALAKALDLKYRNVDEIPFLLNSSKRVTVSASSATSTSVEWLTDNDIFVMTQGGTAPTVIVWGPGNSAKINPDPPNGPIVDTTGAGDSLVAGFLAGVLAKWDPKSCLEYGCRIAAMMITRLGVTMPFEVPEEPL